MNLKRSFYRSMHVPYYIVAIDYIQQSAGIRALHYLCHALNECGMEAYVTCKRTAPHLRTPLLEPAILDQHHIAGRQAITVYPEVFSGDPLGIGGVVVRWLLNRPGHIAGDTTYHADDLIFAYNPSFLPPDIQGRILHIPTCDMAIFNNDNNPLDKKRDLVCMYAHKYLANGGTLTEHVKGAVSLCKDQQLTHAEIASVLRRTKVLYVYEPTALMTEARLCGCPVAVINTEYWRANQPNFVCPTEEGITMDLSEEGLRYAGARVGNYRTRYENFFLQEAWMQLKRFINYTQAVARQRSA